MDKNDHRTIKTDFRKARKDKKKNNYCYVEADMKNPTTNDLLGNITFNSTLIWIDRRINPVAQAFQWFKSRSAHTYLELRQFIGDKVSHGIWFLLNVIKNYSYGLSQSLQVRDNTCSFHNFFGNHPLCQSKRISRMDLKLLTYVNLVD